MHDFVLERPGTIAHAKAALGRGDAVLLAGGQTLLPALKLRLASPDVVVDLAGVDGLGGIAVDADSVTIGAMVAHADVADNAQVQMAVPALASLASRIGDPAVRNRGTLGGSLATSDPGADYPAAVLGLGATIKTDQREIAADDFFRGMFETALEDDEIITAVRFPRPEKAGYAKFANPASRFALVGVMVAKTAGGARVAVTGAGPCVFRVPAMESALDADWSVGAVAGVSVAAEGLNDDIHAGPRYRAHLVTVMAERAVAAAG